MPSLPFSQPKWLEIACAEEKTGIQEERGRDKNNQRILTYLSSVKYLSGIDDKNTSKNAQGKEVKMPTGNVEEWTSTVDPGSSMGGFRIKGGSYEVDEMDPEGSNVSIGEKTSMTDINSAPTVGVRCAKDL